MHDKFEFPNMLKLKLMESFAEHVPSDTRFHVGYMEGKSSIKRWIPQYA